MKSFFLTLFVLLIATDVFAYKLYQTDGGTNIRWTKSDIEIVLDESLAGLAYKEDVQVEVEEAFGVWVDSADLPLNFILVWDTCNEVKDDGYNCIFACEDKSECYARPEEKGGTTYLNISPANGAITDADIVLNADDWDWDINGNLEEGLPFDRVLAHEIGHLLGIDHSEEPDAVMFASLSIHDKAPPVLHDDDVLAARTLYADFVEAEEPTDVAACSVSNVGAANSGAGVFGVLFILFAVFRIKFRGR